MSSAPVMLLTGFNDWSRRKIKLNKIIKTKNIEDSKDFPEMEHNIKIHLQVLSMHAVTGLLCMLQSINE